MRKAFLEGNVSTLYQYEYIIEKDQQKTDPSQEIEQDSHDQHQNPLDHNQQKEP